MLQRSPRRKLFNDYAKQLMRRYPALKEEINARLAHLNSQWAALETAISPQQQARDEDTMLKGEDGCCGNIATFIRIYLRLAESPVLASA